MEEDFNAKEMLESADLDNTEKEISVNDFYSGYRTNAEVQKIQTQKNINFTSIFKMEKNQGRNL